MRHNAVGSYRASEISLDLDAPFDMCVHLLLEKSDARPASRLGAVERAISASDQLVSMNTIIRRYCDTNSDTELYAHILDLERFGNSCCDTSREICGIIEGSYLGQDDRKFVPTNSGKKRGRRRHDRDPASKFIQC